MFIKNLSPLVTIKLIIYVLSYSLIAIDLPSDPASSDLTTKNSSSGKVNVSSDSNSANSLGNTQTDSSPFGTGVVTFPSIDRKSPVLIARNLESVEKTRQEDSSLIESSDVVENTAQDKGESSPAPASIMNRIPTGIQSTESPCSAITGILESSNLLNTLVPTMSSNSESGTLYGLSLKNAPKNAFYNLGLLGSERSKELKVYNKSFLKVFVN
ncbi:hypothetical protein DFH28DRAFT_1064678 [Melampsora americana]|nr:hypothetical protein DFH28DRAFT_1064678 [Melampsora americana]